MTNVIDFQAAKAADEAKVDDQVEKANKIGEEVFNLMMEHLEHADDETFTLVCGMSVLLLIKQFEHMMPNFEKGIVAGLMMDLPAPLHA